MHTTSLGKRDQNSKVWFLLNVYHFHVLLKSKNSKLNCPKSGFVCCLIEGWSAHLSWDLLLPAYPTSTSECEAQKGRSQGPSRFQSAPNPIFWRGCWGWGGGAERGEESGIPNAQELSRYLRARLLVNSRNCPLRGSSHPTLEGVRCPQCFQSAEWFVVTEWSDFVPCFSLGTFTPVRGPTLYNYRAGLAIPASVAQWES